MFPKTHSAIGAKQPKGLTEMIAPAVTSARTQPDKTMIKLKRAYEAASKDDGLRILVERLWPRGVTKQKAKIALWLKDVAPTTELRKWYGHDPARWLEFRKRYWAALKDLGDVLTLLKLISDERTVTFIYAANDEERNSAVALKEFLEQKSILPTP